MWRAFVDEQTPEGLHIIFTNDDTLDETNIREVWDASAKQAKDPTLRRFGKIARLNTQAEVEAFCTNEIAQLTEADATNVVVGAFVSPIVQTAPDPAVEAKYALQRALGEYEMALKIQSVDPSYDVAPFKQAVIDAQAVLAAGG